MSFSVSHKTTEQKVMFETEKSDIEKEIELSEMKANSSKVWTQIALRRKMKYDVLTEVMSHHVEKLWNLAETTEQFKCMNQAYIAMQVSQKTMMHWTKIFEERKENWLKHVGDLAIKKAITYTKLNEI